jgi:hypothetical protein
VTAWSWLWVFWACWSRSIGSTKECHNKCDAADEKDLAPITCIGASIAPSRQLVAGSRRNGDGHNVNV